MITVLIADNEEKVAEILNAMLKQQGNLKLDIIKQENIIKIIKQDSGLVRETTLEDKVIELQSDLYEAKKGVLYKALLERVEKPIFEYILKRTEGNQLKAAKILGLNRNTLHAKVKKLGINTDIYKS